MKALIEVENAGLEGLLGEKITLLCVNYIYSGKLTGVNDKFVELEDPAIVYETGAWNTKAYKDKQSLPSTIYVMLAAVESFGKLKG